MDLRGHHLLCLYGFRGLGYSRRFIDNLQRILNSLRRNYEQKIKLIDNVDDICKYCPYCIDSQCKNNQIETKDLDREVLSKIGLEVNSCHKANKIFGLIKKNIKPINLKHWCQDCPWYRFNYCFTGLKNKNFP